jgi:hypothetical protein
MCRHGVWSAVLSLLVVVLKHHAPSIRLGDLDFFHYAAFGGEHLRTSSDSIVGEFAAILTFFVRDPFLCYIPHRQVVHPA